MFKIRLASSPRTLDEIFKLRHQVFVHEEGKLPPNQSGRIVDRWDAFPGTINVTAELEGRVVGALRLTPFNELGSPADEYWDFSSQLPDDGKTTYAVSWLCVARRHRARLGISIGMMMMVAYYAMRHGIDRAVAPVRPAAAALLERTGFRPLSAMLRSRRHGLLFVPMVMESAHLKDSFIDFIQRHDAHGFVENFHREFYQAGETIVRCGTSGDSVGVVVGGRVSVQDASGRRLGHLENGQTFGEMALLQRSAHPETLIAETDTDVMILERQEFEQQIQQDPTTALMLARILSQRLSDHIEGRARFSEPE